jgi:hypothetical protein|tara:strand:+ start:573 stop:695 length:123 start_codon:yes stop_codon:yes gene_type:complete
MTHNAPTEGTSTLMEKPLGKAHQEMANWQHFAGLGNMSPI